VYVDKLYKPIIYADLFNIKSMFFLLFSLHADVAICIVASGGPNVQPNIPEWVKIAVRLLQASKELANAHYLVPVIV